MDKYLAATQAHIRLAQLALGARMDALESQPKGMSRRYSKMQHTTALLHLIDEVDKLLQSDPDVWEKEKDEVPF